MLFKASYLLDSYTRCGFFTETSSLVGFDYFLVYLSIFMLEHCRLVDQALTNGVKVAVCSTSNEKAV